ncbi:hypothetical protein B0H17DRAFT_940549 [Mycena rosella]|uniref:CxC2-like cysteine cluster KDZ transposase-associated domain-containing protein n=1 Tax=Mycena rosella TaxID=1033263 RepID=A0AAD7D9K6_MYCRO|nr:hypothetical protein B0H17DRAFT_940549 [Mycena rosella]
MGTPCDCGTALCEVMCRDCTQYRGACRACFVKDHKYNYFHWAEVWDAELGFYRRHDMSLIAPPLAVGHGSERCDQVPEDTPGLPFTITHTNGVHRTLIHRCGHKTDPVEPLMKSQLFPATFDKPATAYTFQVMQNFHIHNLESKQSAYDYCGSLMRLTDNAFAAENVSTFIRGAHLWSVVTTDKRMGHLHGIGEVLTCRPEGHSVLLCPACPEPGFNMDPKMPLNLPEELR